MDILGLGLIQINDWFLLFLIIFTSLYKYYTWNFGYFKAQGIKGPKPLPLLGTFLPLMRKGFHDTLLGHSATYGNMYGTFSGRTPALVVSDQEFLKHVFVKDHPSFINRSTFSRGSKVMDSMLNVAKGEHWKALRSIMSPTFSTGKLKVMTREISECAEDFVQSLSQEAGTKKSFEIRPYSGAFTMDVIARTAFGLKINSQQDKNNPFVRTAKKAFSTSYLLILIFIFPFLTPVLRYFGVSIMSAELEEFFTEITNRTMDARKEAGQTRDDFMQLMINSHADNSEENQDDKEHDKEFKEVYGHMEKRRLTHDEVIGQCILFFLAGYETTASTISWLIYNLTIHPDIQEKVYQELLEVVGDREINYDVLSELNLLDMCIQESLRMYSIAASTQRECNKETVIKGITVHKGTVVTAPIHAIHYDPKIWPEPEKFNPYRFTPEEKAKHSSYDWMPFGAGPRNCLAMRLALLEVKIALAHLVRKYKFVRSVETEVPIKLHKLRTAPVNGIWLQIETR